MPTWFTTILTLSPALMVIAAEIVTLDPVSLVGQVCASWLVVVSVTEYTQLDGNAVEPEAESVIVPLFGSSAPVTLALKPTV